jgi:cytochrome c5
VKVFLLGTLIVVLAFTSACVGQSATSNTVSTRVPGPSPAPIQSSTPITLPTAAPIDPAALIEDRCTVCHSIDQIKIARKTAAEWEKAVDTMIGRGAQLNPDERTAVIRYLSFNGKSFIEQKCDTCHPAALALVFKKKMGEWQILLRRKAAYGVEINNAEQELLLGYLGQNNSIE